MIRRSMRREYMRLQPGDRLDFIIQDNEDVVLHPVVTDVRQLKGVLKIPERQPVSVSTMKQIVRKRAGRGMPRLV